MRPGTPPGSRLCRGAGAGPGRGGQGTRAAVRLGAPRQRPQTSPGLDPGDPRGGFCGP